MGQPIFILFISIIIIIILLSYFFSKKAVVKRKLKNATVNSIGTFRNGQIAKIVGHVEFIDEPLIAPLSKRKCSYYYIHIEQRVSTGKSSRWKTIIKEEVSSKFLIREGDNVAFIKDKNIKCYIVQDKSFKSGFGNDATINLEKLLNSRGIDSEGFLGFNKTIRYKEGILENEEKIAVFGKGTWKDTTVLELPNKYDRVLEITANQGVPVYLSDDPDTTLKRAKENEFTWNKRKLTHKQRYSKKQ